MDKFLLRVLCILAFILGLLVQYGLSIEPRDSIIDLRPLEQPDPNYKPDPIPTGALGSTALLSSVG